MVDAALLPALKEALRQSEIGNASPYVLSYARLGRSGASFGVFQGDTNVDPDARAVLENVLAAAGMEAAALQRILTVLGAPLPDGSPLAASDERAVNAALASPAGRQLVDRMDDRILGIIGKELDSSIAAAASRQMRIEPEAQLAIGLWVNMTGMPTALNRWLEGAAIGGLAPPSGTTVTGIDVGHYLANTSFFTMHPRNLLHFKDSVRAGALLLPPGAPQATPFSFQWAAALSPLTMAVAAPLEAGGGLGNHWVYAQGTGNMFHMVAGQPSFLANGYSGRGSAENNPDRQFEEDHGPIPRGTYMLGAPIPFNHMQDCLPLKFDPATNDMHGRSGFLIHDGAHTGQHGNTSHGCICLLHAARMTMWDSHDRTLVVQRDDP